MTEFKATSKVEILPGTSMYTYGCCGASVNGGHKPDCPGYPDEAELMDPETWKATREVE